VSLLIIYIMLAVLSVLWFVLQRRNDRQYAIATNTCPDCQVELVVLERMRVPGDRGPQPVKRFCRFCDFEVLS
jgi:hypothetical protein